MNIYRTRPAPWDSTTYESASKADIVALASPSAAHVWASRVNVDECTAVVIGPSTERAAQDLGFKRIVVCGRGDVGGEKEGGEVKEDNNSGSDSGSVEGEEDGEVDTMERFVRTIRETERRLLSLS